MMSIHNTDNMGPHRRSPKYGSSTWNDAAARDNIEKHLANSNVSGDKMTKAVVMQPRMSPSLQAHTLSTANNSKPGLQDTYLHYDYSERLSTQSTQSVKQDARQKHNDSIPLGDSAPNDSKAFMSTQTAAYASSAAALKPKIEDIPIPYRVTVESAERKAPELPRRDPLPGSAKAIKISSNVPPHKRAPPSISASPAPTSLDDTPEASPNRERRPDPVSQHTSPSFTSYQSVQSGGTGANVPSHKGSALFITSSQAARASIDSREPHIQTPSVAPSQAASESPAAPIAPMIRPSWLKPESRSQTKPADPSINMNSGIAAKSAARDSAFPCSYSDCAEGFSNAKALKRHKAAEHEWCSICDLDCEDDVALIVHRIRSTIAEEGKHIACLKCGDDFGCEAGRDRHTRQAHRELQEIRCPGCGKVFERGAGLLAHVSNNKCKDRSGLISQATLSRGRVDAALELERLCSVSGSVHLATEYGSVDDSVSNGGGGVRVPLSLLDRDDDAIDRELSENSRMLEDAGVGRATDDVSDEERCKTESGEQPMNGWLPGSETRKARYSKPGRGSSTTETMDSLSLAGSKKSATTMGWTGALFPDAKPTPVIGGWTQPKAQSSTFRHAPTFSDGPVSPSIMSGRPVRTDWDGFNFELDIMGKWKCPFQRCDLSYDNRNHLKTHLISGYHQGTDHRCVKCLKNFKSPTALMAHMESSSERCNVRNTEQFGHIIHMVSGGFIDVNNDERGTRLADGQLRMRAPTKAELAAQQAKREEEQMERERQLAAQW